jgi:hypothetical protein
VRSWRGPPGVDERYKPLDDANTLAATDRATALRFVGLGGTALGAWGALNDIAVGRLSEQLTATWELLGAVVTGKQAGVTNALEAGRQDVEEKTAQKLLGAQLHGLVFVGVGVVLVREAYDAVAEVNEAPVADGDAVGVAAETFEHHFGTTEGRPFDSAQDRLGVDDPGGGVKAVVSSGVEGRNRTSPRCSWAEKCSGMACWLSYGGVNHQVSTAARLHTIRYTD